MSTKFAITRSNPINTADASIYHYKVGSLFRPDEIIMRPIASQIDDNLFYSYIRTSKALMLVEYTIDPTSQMFKITKILPTFVESTLEHGSVNTDSYEASTSNANKVYMTVNKNYITINSRNANQVSVINIDTGQIEHVVDFSGRAVTQVYFDSDYKVLVFAQNPSVLLYELNSKTFKTIINPSGVTFGTNYGSYSLRSTSIGYDSVKKKIIMGSWIGLYPTGSATNNAYYYAYVVFGVKNYTLTSTLNASAENYTYITTTSDSAYSSGMSSNQISWYPQRTSTIFDVVDEKNSVVSVNSSHTFYLNSYLYNSSTSSYDSVTKGNTSICGGVISYRESEPRIVFTSRLISRLNNSLGPPALPLYHLLSTNNNKLLVLSYNSLIASAYSSPNTNVMNFTSSTASGTFLQVLKPHPTLASSYSSDQSLAISGAGPENANDTIRFAELEMYGRYIMYSRNSSNFILSAYVTGKTNPDSIGFPSSASDAVLYYITGVVKPENSEVPVNGAPIDTYNKNFQGVFRAGNPILASLYNEGMRSDSILYHEYYENINQEIYLFTDIDNKIKVSVYDRNTLKLKTLLTSQEKNSSTTYDVGLCRDGSKVVLIKYNLTAPRSVEYFISNNEMSGFRTINYVQSTSIFHNSKTAPQLDQSSPVLFTENGVSGSHGFSANGARSSTTASTNVQFVYHKNVDNWSMSRVLLSFETNGELQTNNCSVISITLSGLAAAYRKTIMDSFFMENKYMNNVQPTFEVIAGTPANTSYTVTRSNIPVIGENTSINIQIVASASSPNLSASNNMVGSFNAIDFGTNKILRNFSNRVYSVIVQNETTFLSTQVLEGASGVFSTNTTNAYMAADIRFSSIKFINREKNTYVLKGAFYYNNTPQYNSISTKDEMNFALVKTETDSKLYMGLSVETNPFDVQGNKITYTNALAGAYQAYMYMSSPVQLALHNQYPNKDAYYLPDSVNYAMRIVDTDRSGATLNSLQMAVNGVKIDERTTGLTTDKDIDFLASIQSLFDTEILKDGHNDIQFRLNAGGDLTYFNIPLYKGKLYRLDAVPQLLPTTVITKAHVKAYNGEDELIPVSGIKTQSSSGKMEYAYHYKKDYAAPIRSLDLKFVAEKGTGDTVEIDKMIAVFEGGDH